MSDEPVVSTEVSAPVDTALAPETPQEAAPVAPVEDRAAKLEALLRDRVEKRKSAREEQRAATSYAQKETEWQAKLAEAEEKSKKAQEVIDWQAKFKKSPMQAIKEWGVEPTEVFTTLAQEGTYEAQLENRLKELHHKMEEQAHRYDQYIQQQEAKENAKALEMQKRNQEIQIQEERKILHTRGKEACPTASQLWSDPAEFEEECRKVATLYVEKTGEKVCPWDDLFAYMEYVARERLQPWLAKAVEEAPTVEAKKLGGPKSVSSKMTGERGTSPKPISQMNEREQKEAMLKAARQALGKA